MVRSTKDNSSKALEGVPETVGEAWLDGSMVGGIIRDRDEVKVGYMMMEEGGIEGLHKNCMSKLAHKDDFVGSGKGRDIFRGLDGRHSRGVLTW